jgi:hypothetical protein
LIERAAVDQLAIEVGDVIARLESGLVAGRILDRCDHLHGAVLERDVEAEATIFAVRGRHQRTEALLVKIGAVRIQAGEHAVDRAAQELLVVDLLHILRADAVEDVHELIELAHAVRFRRGEGGGRRGNDCDGADEAKGTK